MISLTRQQYIPFLVVFLGMLMAGYLYTIHFFTIFPEGSDFSKFYMSGKFLLAGKDIYTPVPVGSMQARPPEVLQKIKNKNLNPNLNPPIQTLLLAPLSLFKYPTAYWLWSILSLTSGLMAMSLMAYEFSGNKYDLGNLIISWIILLVYFSTYATIVFGQFSLIIFLALVMTWRASRRKEDVLAGIILGAAISIKVFLGLFFIFFAVQRRWRLLGWMLLSFLFFNVAGLAIFGLDTYITYYQILKSVNWYAASWNASFMAFFTRIFGGSTNTSLWQLPWLAKILADLCSLILLLCLIRVAQPRRQEASEDEYNLGFSLTIVAMLLISPLGWMYYFPCLFIPGMVVWRMAPRSAFNYGYKTLILIGLILSSIPHILITSSELNDPIVWFTWAGFYFYALLLFSGILISLSRHASEYS